jgi:hypothetical protein
MTEDTEHIDWPMCVLCHEYVLSTDERAVGQWRDEHGRRRQAHRECALRNVIGGIGHLRDHDHWCLKMHDPDGGMTYRQSAIAADEWVHKRGRLS